ncbi:cytidine deaminase [Nonlabens sp. YIK11]|uniref:nucleoside deaminase n=1 Tax=Nonlabens sp. YIK11 TaxID=1453349 RepID=UPI0006DC1F9E|nr:nucleoside deaminase [Nonlabens sp. YIK11]KQC33044.1 cytidine deaminase [Nonlabens sp. YIK11]
MTAKEERYMKQCLELARASLDAGDEPFGSILVNAEGKVIATERNRVNEVDALFHPEIELARWALQNLSQQEREESTMYTTGEHCPMCAAAHGWSGIGTLVYLASGKQLQQWYTEMGHEPAPIAFLPVQEILKHIEVKTVSTPEMLNEIKEMHWLSFKKSQDS